MKLLKSLILCFLIPALSFATTPALPKFPPLQFHPPKPERYVLNNGLVVFLLEDHELPLIRVETITRTGSQYETPDKLGLAMIFGEAMTDGGTLTRKPEEIERSLDRRAANASFDMSLEKASGSMSCRATDFDEVFGIFTDLLLHPLFRKDFVELTKGKTIEGLRRMNDEPDEEARREFRIAMYGKDHPYARIPSPTNIKDLKRDDLLAWHARFFHPNNTEIAVSGDFNSAEMKTKIQSALSAWSKGEIPQITIPDVAPPAGPRLFYISRPVDQSQIRIGNFGLARHNPDHFAWEVFNELWGGSAVSRLFLTVRTQQGLAYAVGSAYSEPAKPGLILAVSQTRGPETIAAAQSILKISQDVRPAPFTSGEIQNAKEAIQNRFVENYTSSAQIASEVMNFDFFGYPPDYLDTYSQHIAAVKPADLSRVGQTYLHPEQATILILGDLSTFSKPLSTLGKPQEIKPVDYSQEEP